MQLNPQQESAANHRKGPCLVVSVPGSGKTRVIVERTVRLIREGVPPNRILSLTFTNKAAGEMKERVAAQLGSTPDRMFMGTFHSMCSHVLRKMGHYRGLSKNFCIMDESDQNTLTKKVAKRLLDDDFHVIQTDLIVSSLNKVREDYGDPAVELKEWFHAMFKEDLAISHFAVAMEYLKDMRANNLIDFSGLLYEFLCMIDENEEAKEHLQGSHDYLQVDEVQDTNFAQFTIVNRLAEKHGNVFMVGDISQSIYGWRGARYKNILDFMAEHKDCKLVELGQNYRSTPEIAAVADSLIRNNKSHIGSGIVTVKPSGNPVVYREFEVPENEAQCISNQISMWLNQGTRKPSDIAILYRVNAMSRPLEECLRRLNVPYKLVGGFSFYDRSEIKDCFAMLRLACNPLDTVAFTRLSDFMPGMGEKSVQKIEERALKEGKTFLQMCGIMRDQVAQSARGSCSLVAQAYSVDMSSAKVGQVLAHLVSAMKYEDAMAKSAKKDKLDRLDNVKELVSSVMSPDNANKTVSEYLQQMQLMTSEEEDETKDCVTLMSMHAAKGLEFPSVFVIGVEEKMLPHERAVMESQDGLEEERRLFYVAITRAKDNLFLSSCRNRRRVGGKSSVFVRCAPSRFLREAGMRL